MCMIVYFLPIRFVFSLLLFPYIWTVSPSTTLSSLSNVFFSIGSAVDSLPISAFIRLLLNVHWKSVRRESFIIAP